MARHDDSGPAPRTNHRVGLTRQRILDAAVGLVDAEGLEALSMRRLGKELGVEAMSLYNHVPNKAALLDGLVDHIISQVPIEPKHDNWADQIMMMARTYRRVVSKHPNIAPLLAMRPFTGFTELEPIEYVFGCFREAGFTDEESLHAFRVLASYATGFVLSETGGSFGTGAMVDGSQTIDPDDLGLSDYPNLQAMVPHMIGIDLGAEFEWGLQVLIDGLQEKLKGRSTGA